VEVEIPMIWSRVAKQAPKLGSTVGRVKQLP
jgi:hypothetical protein